MKQESIHPRVYYPSEESHVKNTCKKPNKDRVRNVIAAIEEHLERHPRDAKSAQRVTDLKATL